MPDRVLTLREINRAMLARQMLLERTSLSIPATIERLVGLQAQAAMPPFVGLWTRVQNFRREDLAAGIENRKIIKATLMRATLHLVMAEDYLKLRGTLQPVLTRASEAIAKGRSRVDFALEQLLAMARRYIAETPRTFAEISAMLSEKMPDYDLGAMRYTIRTHIPLIQVPISSGWCYPNTPKFTLAEAWLGQSIPNTEDLRTLVFRYLAAFGPATVTDIQTWSGLVKLKVPIERLKPALVTYRDENGRELLDLPDMPIPSGDIAAPERFLPEFDNLLLSHDKRIRVIAEEHRSKVYLPALRVAATILVDGFVRGAWTVEKKKSAATLVIAPFAVLTKHNRIALTEEAERLIRFVVPDAKTFEVRFAD